MAREPLIRHNHFYIMQALMNTETDNVLLPVALLAAASGARTFTGLAALEPRTVVPVLALGELVADTLPNVPNRNEGLGLLGRVVAGAAIGAIVARRTKADPVVLAVLGGFTSFASAHATYRFRRTLSGYLPALGAAIVEDATVLAAATAGARLLQHAQRELTSD